MSNKFNVIMDEGFETLPINKTINAEVTANLASMAFGLDEAKRERLEALIQVCFLTGAIRSLELVKQNPIKLDKLLDACKEDLDDIT